MFTFLTNGYISRRVEMMLLLCSGIVIVYTLRVNMSVAAQSMRDELSWSETQRGLVLSAFYWGYTGGQMFGSYLTSVVGGKVIFGLSVFIPSLITLFVPLAANHSVSTLLFIRCLIGFFESATFPAVFYFFPIWVPEKEKTKLIPLATSGMFIGEIIGFSLSGVLIESSITFSSSSTVVGWPLVFYVFGFAGLIWFPFWLYFAYESPLSHPYISLEEKQIIEGGTNYSQFRERESASVLIDMKEELLPKEKPTNQEFFDAPWREFFTRKEALTLLVSSFVYGWINFTLLSELPAYLNDQLGFGISSSGILCIIPYGALFIFTIGFGNLFDYFQQKDVLSTNQVRQSAMFISYGLTSVFLILCGYMNNQSLAYFFVIMTQVTFGANQSGLGCAYLDIAPRYSSVYNSLGNTIGSGAGIIGPLIVSHLLESYDKSITGWRVFFFITFGMSLFILVLWVLFQTSTIMHILNNPSSSFMR